MEAKPSRPGQTSWVSTCGDSAPPPLTAACLHYDVKQGDAALDVCYWGDMTFVPHLITLLSKPRVAASLSLLKFQSVVKDRKELVCRLHREVSALRVGLKSSANPAQQTPRSRKMVPENGNPLDPTRRSSQRIDPKDGGLIVEPSTM